MRAAPLGWVVIGASLWVATANAQLPLPELDVSSPEIRLASTDDLLDRAQGVLQRTERRLAERRTELRETRTALDDEITALRESQDPRHPDPARELDLGNAAKLSEVMGQELETLEDAVAVARRAVRAASSPVSPPDGERIGLDDVIRLEREALQLDRDREAQSRVAQQLQAIAKLDLATSERGSSLRARLDAANWRLQAARADLETARALELSARARAAGRRADDAAEGLAVASDEVSRIEQELSVVARTVRAEVDRLREERTKLRASLPETSTTAATVADPSLDAQRGAMIARLDLLDRREDALQAELTSARAKAAVAIAVSAGLEVSFQPGIDVERMQALLAKVDQQREALDDARAKLLARAERLPVGRVALRTSLERWLRVYDETITALDTERRHHEATWTLARLARARQERRSAGPTWSRVLWTALVLLLAFVAITRGLPWVRVGLKAGGPLWSAMRLDGARRAQLDAALILLWPMLVVLVSAAVLLWPIWGASITVLEALRLVDQPLFYVEAEPVSAFSVAQLVFFIWASVALSRWIRDFLERRVYVRVGWDIGLTNAFNTLVHYVVIMVGVLLGLRSVGIGLSSLAIFAGVLGIGIGFGLRNITENFISGLIILAERPIKIGDYVDDGTDVQGEVRQIRARSTTLVTRDNISLIIPNSEFVSGRVTNWSHGDAKVRIPIAVGVAYGSNTELVRKLLVEVATKHGQVLKRPKPEVQFADFGSSSLDMLLYVWIDEQQHRFRIASDLRFAIDKTFRKSGVEIAFPQLDVHFKSVAGPVAGLIGPPAPPVPPVAESSRPSSSVRPRSQIFGPEGTLPP
jgi:small-conductance mechanosensitive channel